MILIPRPLGTELYIQSIEICVPVGENKSVFGSILCCFQTFRDALFLNSKATCQTRCHYSNTIMGAMAYQSSASRLFTPFIQVQIKENSKASRH